MQPVSPEVLPFRVLECRVYRGPHLYSHTPMIRIQADLGTLEERPTDTLDGFSQKLVECLPGLKEHGCSAGRPGGFIERLQEGTWIGHVVEHVALELQAMAGVKATRGKTRSINGRRGHYNIMYAYQYEEAGRYAGRLAMELIASLLPTPFNNFEACEKAHEFSMEAFDLERGLDHLKDLVRLEKLGPTTQALVDEAERRGIPWLRLDKQSLIQFGTGKYRKLVRASITSATSNIAVDAASDKELTKKLLAAVNIPVPMGDVVRTVEGAIEAAQEIGFPVVIKPFNANHGRGVTTDLNNADEVTHAFARAKAHANYLIVEKYYKGRDYRVLVVNGDVVAAAERVPAHVIGNGADTVAELIAKVNEDPRRGNGHENVMTRIIVDDALTAWLARSGMTLETVPAKRQRIVLAATANLSTGGVAIDCTDVMHTDNIAIAKRAALTIGLDIAGIDLILPDITRSWRETGGGIIEVNAAPGFRMHLHPAQGKSRNVAKPVLSMLFPEHTKTHVPIVTVTGTNGKSTTVRMIAHIMRQSGKQVGFTSTSGIYIGDECIWEGDASGPKSARLLLQDPTLDVAILETARGGILREGLGVQECDVGAVLNVTADHIGLGGIDTLDDLAAVKSVVSEAVRSDGISVLNADDRRTFHMARYAGGDICYFSMLPAATGPVRNHVEKGGLAITREYIGAKPHLMLHQDGARTPIIAVQDIPATFNGAAAFNVENALAAAAIATGLGVSPLIIRNALSSFTSSYEQNPGRFNIHDAHGFRVIMDYAHNPAALEAFFKVIQEMRPNYNRVIGTASTPGDRRDDDIREVGRIAAQELDIIVFREAPDRRGRKKGEILRSLSEGARSIGCSEDRIICVDGEEEATNVCLSQARGGDLVILMPTEVEACWKQILAHTPDPSHERTEMIHNEERLYA